MKKTICALSCAFLILAMAACDGKGAAVTPSPAPVPPAAESPVVQTSAPAPAESGFAALPVTEQGILDFYAAEGYYTVRKITPYEGDFLVELTDGPEDAKYSLLYWIFGATGRTVQLNGMSEMLDYRITGRGQVTVMDSGVSWVTPVKGMPATYHYSVLGDENGQVDPDYAECRETRDTTWLDPAEPLYVGWWDGDMGWSVDKRPSTGVVRREQVYDARMDADGLSFSFIPQGGSAEDKGNFIAASTTTPSFDTSFDPATRLFTLRLYSVSLSSGKAGEEYEGVAYPYEFPAGSLGADGHFITDAQIKADGEDVVVMFHLADRAYRFTVESGNLGYDNIPMLRLVFREYNNDLDE